jgi:hypothetical protein
LDVEDLPLAEVGGGVSVRASGVSEEHVEGLMVSQGRWPPIIVWGPGNRVVDGQHRVFAARRLGMELIGAVRFVGDEEEAFVEAVRRNVGHGLPLTIPDRTRAAERILEHQPEWSDRLIAGICAMAPRTVAKVRSDMKDRAGILAARRVGRDGRRRPEDPAALRAHISRVLQTSPERSLREVAHSVGASPETVRSVKKGLAAGAGSGTGVNGSRSGNIRAAPPVRDAHPATTDAGGRWRSDVALVSLDGGSSLVEWFEDKTIGEEWREYAAIVPISRAYELADEARRRANAWCEFALSVEAKIRRTPFPGGEPGVGVTPILHALRTEIGV